MLSAVALLLLAAPVCADEAAPGMIDIPGGEYSVGDAYCQDRQGNSDWCADETPHKVKLDAYSIDKYEATNEQYYECAAESKCRPNDLHESRPKDFSYMKQPAVFVRWKDAEDFCRWKGGRLPTEAEWEVAAQADDLGGAHFGLNYNSGSPRFVGSLNPNSRGLHDMLGNVYEWVADWYGPYQTQGVADNPKGPAEGKEKGARGGSWNSARHFIRASDRVSRFPDFSYSDVGFRCARSRP